MEPCRRKHPDSAGLSVLPRGILDHETLDLVLQGSDLCRQVRSLVGSNAGSNYTSRNTASATQRDLGRNVDISATLGVSNYFHGHNLETIRMLTARSCPRREAVGGGG